MVFTERQPLCDKIEQQCRLIRGLVAALYGTNDTESAESLLRELGEADEAATRIAPSSLGQLY
jgi:hypothetical protein